MRRFSIEREIMKKLKKILINILIAVVIITVLFIAFGRDKEDKIPSGFVNVKDAIPSIHINLRYASDFNVTGKRVDGFSKDSQCYLTKQATEALKLVQNKLIPMNLSLKLYDCYRPQKATDNFIRWSKNHDESMKKFFPDVDKKDINFTSESPRSRGSSVAVAIVDLGGKDINKTKHNSKSSCIAPFDKRKVGNSLDFGTSFSCLSPKSHLNNMDITPQARANRLLLRGLMSDAGFIPTDRNWWDFTLKNEPYKNTYFDFNL